MNPTVQRRLAGVAIVVYFLWFAGRGLEAGFSHDDLMNLYRAWTTPLGDLVRDTLRFWTTTPVYRPVGALFYRVSFELFGFHPAPLRIACFALLLGNLLLLYRFVERATGSPEAGALAAVLGAYHGRVSWLYYSTGLCYDLLCFTFYFAALNVYLGARRAGRLPGRGETAAIAGLYLAALGSKEMAVSFPVVVLAWELLNARPRSVRWLWREGLVAWTTATMTGLYINGRVFGVQTIGGLDAYRPEIRFAIFNDRMYHYVQDLVYGAAWLTPDIAAAAVAAVFAVAWVGRNSGARLATVLLAVGVLPVAFIRQRGLDALYVPLAGAALLGGWMIAAGSRRLGDATWRAPLVFGLVLAAVTTLHQRLRTDPAALLAESREIGSVIDQLRALRLEPPRGGRVLFVRDPFPEEDRWSSLYILRALGRDPLLIVDRADQMATEPDRARYDVVLTWQNGKLSVIQNP